MDGKLVTGKYFISTKKIYSERFSTDCFAAFFEERARNCTRGISDIPEYGGVRPTLPELASQNSYFILDLMRNLLGDDLFAELINSITIDTGGTQ